VSIAFFLQGLHSASVPGILALDIHPTNTSKILTGGADKNATVFNKDTEHVVAILKGHQKKVTRVVYHPDEVIFDDQYFECGKNNEDSSIYLCYLSLGCCLNCFT